ncbi:MAG TPA: hypothetical protein VKU19_36575 [Bryobacteraceae bacterium]|nr:hypothetical protein [Bryobacteraceae bacterium]
MIGPFETIEIEPGRKAPFYILQFDKSGSLKSQKTAAHLISALESGDFSDVYIFSHGWNNTFDDALKLYRGFFRGYQDLRRSRKLNDGAYKPLFLGIHWPSIILVLPWESGPKIAATPAAAQPESVEDNLGRLKDLISELLPEESRPDFYELMDQPALNARQSAQLAGILAPLYAGSELGEGFGKVEADALVDLWKSVPSDATKPTGEFGFADDSENTTDEPTAAFSLKDLDPRNAARVTTVLIMKDRAGLVGNQGVGPLLAKMLAAGERRFHLIGHSYGCRVLLAAVCVPYNPPPAVDTMLLLQPAVNMFCFAPLVPDKGVKGGFRAALDRVRQPIYSTFSDQDTPLHGLFHLAARRSSDLGEVRIAAGEPSIYGALGGYGPGGLPSSEGYNVSLLDSGKAYPREDHVRIYGLNGAGGRITGHSDISKDYTWWALLDQVSRGAK